MVGLLKFEDGQVRLQSRLEQEEEAKAALMGRIQRLTKLILVSTKTSQPSRFPHHPRLRRRHSFGEEEVSVHPVANPPPTPPHPTFFFSRE